jgi:PiT family inorganic phosphate transporter
VIVDVVILLAIAAAIYIRSRKSAVGVHNVNDEWTGSVAPDQPEPAAV